MFQGNFRGNFKGVSRKFQGYSSSSFRGVSRMFPRSFEEVSRTFKGISKNSKCVSMKNERSFKEVFSGAQRNLKEIPREFQGSLKYV